jgi:tetratricopeptide (TPR) repeat protein
MAADQNPPSDPTQDTLKKADQLRLAGHFDQAETLLEGLISQNPFLAPAKLALGRVFFESGNLNQAQAILEEFCEFVPDHPLANKILAKIYINDSKTAKAKAKLNLVLQSNPEDTFAERMMQDLEKAPEEFVKHLDDEDTKKNPAPINTATIAEIYRSQGHLPEALQIYKELLSKEGNNPVYQQKTQELERQIAPQSPAAKKMTRKEKLEDLLQKVQQYRTA